MTECGFSFHRHKQVRMQQQGPEASAATAEQHDNKNQGTVFTLSLCLSARGEPMVNKPKPGAVRSSLEGSFQFNQHEIQVC